MTAPPHRPVTADQIRSGDPVELSEGRRVACLPTGRRGGRRNGTGFEVLDSDPSAEAAAIDLGVSPRPDMLRAPDIAVGPIPDEPGWATEAPPLAVEYADTGQDEAELQRKIDELLSAGTRWIWVVRLEGKPRVEVYEAAASAVRKAPARRANTPSVAAKPARSPARVAYPGETLLAPGVLKNPVLVEALYDREAAHEATLRNLLQRRGYADLHAVLAEGRREGHKQGLTEGLLGAVLGLCEVLDLALSPERETAIDAMDVPALQALYDHIKQKRRWP